MVSLQHQISLPLIADIAPPGGEVVQVLHHLKSPWVFGGDDLLLVKHGPRALSSRIQPQGGGLESSAPVTFSFETSFCSELPPIIDSRIPLTLDFNDNRGGVPFC